MKVSLNWIKYYRDLYKWSADPAPDGVNKLVERIGSQLGAVEEVVDLGKKYEGALVAKVMECVKHPNADKLSLCLIDDGQAAKKTERNKQGLVQVVCGAPNVKAGQLVVWLPPGVTVPSTYDKDSFVLEARELRGQMSNGMIASAKELDLGDDHTGILILDDSVKPGQSFAEAYGLDDYIIDIENKMFTHRPDLFGMMGIARELAGIQGETFKSPSWYKEDADLHNDGRKNVLKLAVKNELPKIVPRFTAVAIKDVKVEASPAWLRTYLARVGVRPINNIVDMTNYYMLLTAQPLHAYDYDKVGSGVLGVRLSKDKETVKLIGGKQISLRAGAVVITDGEKPIGLGGVMGGADTEVDETTKSIILEVADFDMNTTRRTAMEYGLFTDAATRFTKNQSPRQQRAVLVKAAEDIRRVAGGRVASRIVDLNHSKTSHQPLGVSVDFINSRLGLTLLPAEIKKLLENVEFIVKTAGAALEVTPPFWRTDIEIEEDVIEEVGRLYGYDSLPLALPERSLKAPGNNPAISLKSQIRQSLRAAGANEVLTYSFVHQSLFEKTGQDPKDAYHIKNALSPDLQYYRQSLTPSLLDKVHPNIKAGFDQFAIFEINKVHIKGLLDEEKLPKEFSRLGLVCASQKPETGAAYYKTKKYLEFLLDGFNESYSLTPLAAADLPRQWLVAAACYEPVRSAAITVGKKIVGIIGEPKTATKLGLKLPSYSAQFEIDTDVLARQSGVAAYEPINKYPETAQDLCLRLPAATSYGEAENFLLKELAEAASERGYNYRLEPIDIFAKQSDKTHKQITWHIVLSHSERTLTTEEVNKLFDMIAGDARAKLKAERV